MDLKLVPRINGRILSRFGLRLERTRPSKVLADQGAEPDPDPGLPIEDVDDDFRYRTGNWTYTVPVERMVSRPIFGYGPRSWHPLKAGCAELLDNIDAPYESSILRRFYATFTPSTVAEAYRLIPGSPLDELKPQSLFEPWLLDSPPFDNPHADAFPAGTPLFGPVSEQEGQTEWRRLRRSVSSVLEYGYQPDLFPRGRIAVSVLRSRGEERYLVGHGIHRTSVMAAMGADRLAVGIREGLPAVIDESDAESWPYVRSGFISVDTAVHDLRRYFTTPESDPALEIAAACGAPDPLSFPPSAV